MTNNLTVLDTDHAMVAEKLLSKLKDEMSEEDYMIELQNDVQRVVQKSICDQLSVNAPTDDLWWQMGFRSPEDFLNAKDVSEGFEELISTYIEEDQPGYSFEILKVIMDYAEEYDVQV